mgnify:CR=1 FL=1|tara:strand:+ start:1124 stop:1360 length:237 start_codon:yes stop_codon:yes gene_type:complete
MAKTKEEKLSSLFDLVCDDLTSRIVSGEATSSDLNVSRQFLKDNGVTATPAEDSPLNGLVNALPFPSAGEVSQAAEGN